MLHYIRSGKGTQTMVLLHGYLESSAVWRDMIHDLEETYQIVQIDLPGHGKSAPLEGVQTMEKMAAAIHETLEQLGVTNFHLVGHSMGGYISLAYAEAYPDDLRSFTLFYSTFLADTAEKKENRKRSIPIIEQEFGKYVNAGVALWFNPHEKERLQEQMDFGRSVALGTSIEGAVASVRGMMQRPDRTSVMKNFSRKILVITGRFDAAVNTPATLAALPDRENIKAYMVDSGHQGHLEKPWVCTAILKTELR